MDRARIHEGVRRMRFEDILGRLQRSELSQMEAAELLGISERTFRRWRDRHREAGPSGLADRRLEPSPRRAPVAEIERMLGLYRDLYRGFTVKHFHEQLAKRHNYVLGYTVTKLHLQRAGLVPRAKQRSAHRKKRPRRPLVGMMLHQDASTHAWLPGDVRTYDLVVTMDDATSALYSAFLVDEEGTASSLRGLREVVAARGLFCALYTDRGSHYFFTPEAGGKVSKTTLTQVGRAPSQLGIEHIAARYLHCRAQCAICGRRGAGGIGVRCGYNGCLAGDIVHPGGSHGGPGQYGEVGWAEPATTAEPSAPAFCQSDGASAWLSRRRDGGFLGTTPAG